MEEGLDFRAWIEEGLLDSFICQEGVDPEDIACCKRHGCQFILFPGYREPTPTTPKTVAEGYGKGVDGIAIWDIDPDAPEAWEWIRRIGHREEMEAWEEHVLERRRIPLVTVGGFDVAQGLQASVYSGGGSIWLCWVVNKGGHWFHYAEFVEEICREITAKQ